MYQISVCRWEETGVRWFVYHFYNKEVITDKPPHLLLLYTSALWFKQNHEMTPLHLMYYDDTQSPVLQTERRTVNVEMKDQI